MDTVFDQYEERFRDFHARSQSQMPLYLFRTEAEYQSFMADQDFKAEEDSEDDELSATTRVDELVCVSVWNIFAKTSTARGFDCRSKSSVAASKVFAKKRAALGVGSWRETARDLRIKRHFFSRHSIALRSSASRFAVALS